MHADVRFAVPGWIPTRTTHSSFVATQAQVASSTVITRCNRLAEIAMWVEFPHLFTYTIPLVQFGNSLN